MTEPRVFLRPDPDADLVEARTDLFDLITKGQALLAKESREKAKKVTEEQSQALAARHMRQAQAMADRFEWKPRAAVALFAVQICEHCGTIHSQFAGFGTLFLRKYDATERIAKADCLDRGLPLVRRELMSKSPACIDCIDEVVHQPLPPPVYHNRKREDASS